MKNTIGSLAVLATAGMLLAACANEVDDVDASLEETAGSPLAPEGMSLNGMSLNGMSLNGLSLNGLSLNGLSLNGLSLNGLSLNGLSLNGLSLNGATLGGVPIGSLELRGSRLRRSDDDAELEDGSGIAGAMISGLLDNGMSLPIRIDSRKKAPGTDLYMYGVSYPADSSWKPLCGLNSDGTPVLAIPLAGRWDYHQGIAGGGSKIEDATTFTFACRGHALAKCVELGYEPWQKVKVCTPAHGCKKQSLAPYHQACTRMIRADYCGDGTSFTVDGTLINLYDEVGIQSDTESWKMEAEWTPDGAACMARRRIATSAVPSCWSDLHTPDCGATSHFGSDTLLMNEDAPAP